MIKNILVLAAVAGMISIGHSTLEQTEATKPRTNRGAISNSQSTPALKMAPAKVTRLDPLKYEFITGPINLGPHAHLLTSVVNCRDQGDEYVQIEIHTASTGYGISPTQPTLYPTPSLARKSDLTKVGPGNVLAFPHVPGRSLSGSPYYWVKIKTSSEYLIPKITHISFLKDPTDPRIIQQYMPGDFAVYTRDPLERIR